VLLDEMEFLYHGSDAEESKISRKVLSQIHELSDNDEGRTSFFGCTSSSLLYPMVNGGKLHKDLKETHFKTAYQVDMNGEKIGLHELEMPSPTHPDTVAVFCREVMGEENKAELDKRHRRLAMFAHGGNVRRLCKRSLPTPLYAPVDVLEARDANLGPYVGTFMRCHVSAPSSKSDLYRLLEALYDQLVLLNSKLLKQALGKATREVDPGLVAGIRWDEAFKPLTYTDVHAAAKDLNIDAGVIPELLKFLHYDAAFIVMVPKFDATGFLVYPCSIYALVLHAIRIADVCFSGTDWGTAVYTAMCKTPEWVRHASVQKANWKAGGQELWSLLIPW
jgi:hypothetical protein